jgi:hypothetical protein
MTTKNKVETSNIITGNDPTDNIKSRRRYKQNVVKAAMIYLIYLDYGEKIAFKYADKIFGKSKQSNWALKKKLELYANGGWKKDWLTRMYRDLQEIINKNKK